MPKSNLKKPKKVEIPKIARKPIGEADTTKELKKRLEERRKKLAGK